MLWLWILLGVIVVLAVLLGVASGYFFGFPSGVIAGS